VELARNLYLVGITHIRILEHGLVGGGPSRGDEHEGRWWKKIYGIPFDLFLVLSGQFEDWLKAKNKTTYRKKDMPLKLHPMACFHQLCLGCPMHQHREGYRMVTTVFQDFFFSFLDWLWNQIIYICPRRKKISTMWKNCLTNWLFWVPREKRLCSRSMKKLHIDITNTIQEQIHCDSCLLSVLGCTLSPLPHCRKPFLQIGY
jgi:hypothetical protein